MDELFINDEQLRAREKAPERLICFSRPLIAQTENIEAVIARRLQKQLEALEQLGLAGTMKPEFKKLETEG